MSCDLCLPLPLEWRGVSKAPCPDPRLPGLQSTHVSHENICHSLLNGYSLKMIFFFSLIHGCHSKLETVSSAQ